MTSIHDLENEKSYVFVGHLKSASQSGTFKTELNSPVVAWHVTYGQVKRRQVVRVRRQAVAQTPVPTSSFVTPTSAIVTRVIETPIMTKPPSVFTVTPTPTEIISSPTQTARPYSPTTPHVNQPPRLNKAINNITAEIGQPFSFNIPPNTFLDDEDGQTPNLRLDMFAPNGDLLPSNLWVKLNPNKQVLVGDPPAVGITRIALIVTDKEGLKSSLHEVFINVVPKNEPPYLFNHIDLIPLYVGQPIVFKVPFDTFYDKEDGATPKLTLSMTTTEDEKIDSFSWVTFDAKTQTIYALPRGSEVNVGKYEFLMVAYDSGKKKAVDAFEFHINPAPVEANHYFGLQVDTSYKTFDENVTRRVLFCVKIGEYFGDRFNTSYKDIRVNDYEEGSVILKWYFANIATNLTGVYDYKSKYVLANTEYTPLSEFENVICPNTSTDCSVTKVWVKIIEPPSTSPGPNVIGRVEDDDDGTWWEYTIIPAFVVAAIIFIIGLIIIICIRCRRKSKLDKNDKVVFVQRRKPAVFREEYPMREFYGNQPLITPNEKAPLPPPAYPRSSTPTEDPSERLLNDSSPSYQPPFDNNHEPAGSSRPPVASYRLPPPYVAP